MSTFERDAICRAHRRGANIRRLMLYLELSDRGRGEQVHVRNVVTTLSWQPNKVIESLLIDIKVAVWGYGWAMVNQTILPEDYNH